ncbi:polar amino acid transport system substrate-binding protein [Inhella inkyongensis]|uniref:Polar amino acid transport system substrate-binding protein n=1 Tax=Inhella inkyongensis TaxID=392593 RepID=A0A840S7U6_9BURK|nr:transporter substrate-binding domain-containing protein [Inhella inkyongensis]MBB5205568.1 polar amino acid transport system substrate-binding protein [Inhella inkyongensis]
MRFWVAQVGVFFCLSLAIAQPAIASAPPIKVCDDVAEWPPFTYRQRGPNGEVQAVVQGFSVDVLRQILSARGRSFQIELLPWLRCLREVESGTVHLALNASANAERAKQFRLSLPYYGTTHSYFYSRRRFPKGLRIQHVDELKRYHLCGVHGYSYAAYGLSNNQIDQGAFKFSQVVAKLHAQRCDVGIEKYEAVAGARLVGPDLLADPDLGHGQIPGLDGGEFHMLISRSHPEGEALHALINQGITQLKESGQMRTLWRRYLPNSPYE